jgi:AcrR family transcriptional regulator
VTTEGGTPELRAADGRVPGRRGQATRRKLLDCTANLLGTSAYRDLKVTDISREAGTSPATFYHYFPDIEAALIVLAHDTSERGAGLAHLVGEEPWRGTSGYRAAHDLVEGFLAFWREHQPVLRVVDLLTEEGDERFRAIRVRMLNHVTRALADAIATLQERGQRPDDVDPMAMGATLVSMLAHVAAHQSGMESWSIPVPDLRESMARLVFGGVTGRRVAAPR